MAGTESILVPKHSKLSEKEVEKLLLDLQVSVATLPRILITDPAIQHLDIKKGDVIKIERKSETAGTSVFYRRVSNA